MKTKKAFTLIELIITIVVIGIVVTAFPLIITQSQVNNDFAIQQEAIFRAKSQLGVILKAPWDKNSYDPSNPYNPLGVLRVSKVGDTELNPIDSTGETRRIGHFKLNNRRAFFDSAMDINGTMVDEKRISASVIPNKSNTIGNFGMEDYNKFIKTMQVESSSTTTTGTGDFLVSVNLIARVLYVSDKADYSKKNITDANFDIGSVANTTNIKMIEVNATRASDNQTLVSLRAFVSNIGQSGDGLLRRTSW